MSRFVAFAVSVLLLSVSARADDISDHAGRWVFNQNDGHGGPGCLMDLTTKDAAAGSLKLTIENPDSCFDVTKGLATWFMNGDMITLGDADGAGKLDLTYKHSDDGTMLYNDASGTYYMERLGDAE